MAHAQPLDAIRKSFRQILAADKLQEGALRIGVGEHAPGAEFLATFQPHADGAAALQDDPLDCRAGTILDSMRAAGRGHRLGDRAHAAAGVTPGTALSLEFAERMMEVRNRRARRIQAGEIAGDTMTGGDVAHWLTFEPALGDLIRGRSQ